MYGIRGATTIQSNTRENILDGTRGLLENIFENNKLEQDDVVSIIFTTTQDLNAEFPAKAARLMGLENIPLLGCVEADVPHGLPLCIRILVHAYLKEGTKIKHIYLNDAVKLRPDLVL
jgi:chorismate mutase